MYSKNRPNINILSSFFFTVQPLQNLHTGTVFTLYRDNLAKCIQSMFVSSVWIIAIIMLFFFHSLQSNKNKSNPEESSFSGLWRSTVLCCFTVSWKNRTKWERKQKYSVICSDPPVGRSKVLNWLTPGTTGQDDGSELTTSALACRRKRPRSGSRQSDVGILLRVEIWRRAPSSLTRLFAEH